MKHNTINTLLLALPGLILSTSILSAFSLLAFCMRSIPMALLLVGISVFGWSGILAAITKFYDKLMNIWQTKSYPLFIGSWMLLSFLETRLESRVSQAKNSDYVVPHKTYEKANA